MAAITAMPMKAPQIPYFSDQLSNFPVEEV